MQGRNILTEPFQALCDGQQNCVVIILLPLMFSFVRNPAYIIPLQNVIWKDTSVKMQHVYCHFMFVTLWMTAWVERMKYHWGETGLANAAVSLSKMDAPKVGKSVFCSFDVFYHNFRASHSPTVFI